MCRSIVVLALSLACACSGGDPLDLDAGTDGGLDAASDGARDAVVDAAPDAPACTCTGVSTCCDGCLPQNPGMACAGGPACTKFWCNAGACVSSGVPVACTAPTEPECQAAACTEPSGCAVTSIREGLTCNDDNPATGDEHCSSGTCVGTPCECTSGPCCDGCFFRPASFKCVDDGHVRATCTGPDVYGGLCSGMNTIHYRIGDRFCTGASAACSGTSVEGPSSSFVPCEPGGENWDHPTVCRTDAADPLGARCAMWCE